MVHKFASSRPPDLFTTFPTINHQMCTKEKEGREKGMWWRRERKDGRGDGCEAGDGPCVVSSFQKGRYWPIGTPSILSLYLNYLNRFGRFLKWRDIRIYGCTNGHTFIKRYLTQLKICNQTNALVQNVAQFCLATVIRHCKLFYKIVWKFDIKFP